MKIMNTGQSQMISKDSFKPSHFQKVARDWAEDAQGKGEAAVMVAVAGSGKSRTLRYTYETIAHLYQRMLLVCFGKDNAIEAREKNKENKNIRNLDAKTYHSFLYTAITKKYKPQLEKFGGEKVEMIIKPKLASNHRFLLGPIKKMVSLCKGNAIPNPDDGYLTNLAVSYDIDFGENTGQDLIQKCFELTRLALEESINMVDTIIDFDDMIFLPIVMGLQPDQYDAILADEFQDTNRAQALGIQMGRKDMMMGVGDPHQCQPGSTQIMMTGGGTKRLFEIQVGDEIASYDRRGGYIVGTQTQGRKVLEVEKHVYDGDMISVSVEDKRTYCTPNHKWIVRWSERTPTLYATYIMQKGEYFRVGQCQLFTTDQGSNHFALRCRLEGADKGWIINVHDNRRDAVIEEAIISATHNIPMNTFKQVGNQVLDSDAIETIFNSVLFNTPHKKNAMLALERFGGRDYNYPYYIKHEGYTGRTTLFEVHACNLISEYMTVPCYEGNRKPTWKQITLNKFPYHGYVYSLDVETHHTYIANGIATHNSIYAFRGADSTAMQKLIDQFSATTLPLSICYRCPQAVGDLIRSTFPYIDFQTPEWAIPGSVSKMDANKSLEMMQDGDLVVSRVNAVLPTMALALIRMGKTARIMGRDIGKSLIALINKQNVSEIGELFTKLRDYREKQYIKFAAANRPDKIQQIDDQVETILALSDGCNSVWDLVTRCNTMFTDERVGIQLGTVHKNKGREAKNVFIARPDLLPLPFVMKKGNAEAQSQERNCQYVSYSRALENLIFLDGEIS